MAMTLVWRGYTIKDKSIEEVLHHYDNKIIMIDSSIDQDDVYKWCRENNVRATFIGRFSNNDLWLIRDQYHKLLFSMRWT